MLNHPPIDSLAGKTKDNKYLLCCLVSKRAKELEKRIPAELESGDKKSIALASEEIYNGKVVCSDNEDLN